MKRNINFNLYYSRKYQPSGKTRKDTGKNEHDAFTQRVKSRRAYNRL